MFKQLTKTAAATVFAISFAAPLTLVVTGDPVAAGPKGSYYVSLDGNSELSIGESTKGPGQKYISAPVIGSTNFGFSGDVKDMGDGYYMYANGIPALEPNSCRIHFQSRAAGQRMTVFVDPDTPCKELGAGRDMSGYEVEFRLVPGAAPKFY
jgi:hypothetical protein